MSVCKALGISVSDVFVSPHSRNRLEEYLDVSPRNAERFVRGLLEYDRPTMVLEDRQYGSVILQYKKKGTAFFLALARSAFAERGYPFSVITVYDEHYLDTNYRYDKHPRYGVNGNPMKDIAIVECDIWEIAKLPAFRGQG